MENLSKPVNFRVTRNNPELIAPAIPTPYKIKALSDFDNQDSLRFHIPVIQIYRRSTMQNKDPVDVIRQAIAKALIFYYPFAGRLRECAARKLVVECTGEGILFIEANADVALQHLEGSLHPPFPYLHKLIYNVPGSDGVINCPLILIQVTRLTCGGFVVALRLNHTMSDAAGLVQFMSAVGELARGAEAPTIKPVWQRHLLNARKSASMACTHYEYDTRPQSVNPPQPQNMVESAFFFSSTDINALRSLLPQHLFCCSRFELVGACIWWCRTIALSLDPDQEIRISCLVDCRKRFDPLLPKGFYGNAIVYPVTVTTAERLSKNPLQYALELVRNTISQATQEYMKSFVDLIATNDRPPVDGTFILSDLTRAGFSGVDFGWGTAAYGGPAQVGVDWAPSGLVFVSLYKDGIMVPISLPANAMDIFRNKLHTIMTAARETLFRTASAL